MEDERTNHEFLEDEASRPRARVVVLHRENDTAAGAQVEFNSYGSPFHFDVELARQGCSVVYPAAPQTRSRGAGAPLLRPASPPTSDDDDDAPARPPALTADTEALAAAATAAVRRAVDEDGIAADRVFVGGFDG